MDLVTIHAPQGPIRARIALPRSKSIANRALIAADLAGDRSVVQHLSDGADTRILARLLQLRPRVMHCGLGGTTFRFLLAWAAVQEGEEHVITGEPDLLDRPHDDLIAALRTLGVSIEHRPDGYHVNGSLLAGGAIAFDSPISSQYLSALMLIAPRMEQGLRIAWTGTQLSRPYVEMSARLLQQFGVAAQVGEKEIFVPPGAPVPKPVTVPPDWSAAAFWYQIAMLGADARVELEGLHREGWQGDECIAELLEPFVHSAGTAQGLTLTKGQVPKEVISMRNFHLQASPDLFQPLAFGMAGAGIHAHFTGLDNLSGKESDRVATVALALEFLGVRFDLEEHTLTIHPSPLRTPPDHVFDTYGDHRMAMALAPLALKLGSIVLHDPDVVDKSYPGYWDDLQRAGFRIVRH